MCFLSRLESNSLTALNVHGCSSESKRGWARILRKTFPPSTEGSSGKATVGDHVSNALADVATGGWERPASYADLLAKGPMNETRRSSPPWRRIETSAIVYRGSMSSNAHP